ncbi:MAG: hypothetical protein QG646_4018, partial [Euryarchaeota archaeon]|nr:hypothetical protein [Euryarchaeota archaeon]
NSFESINIKKSSEFIYNVKNENSLQIIVFKYFKIEPFIELNIQNV